MNKYQLIEYLNALVKAITEDQCEAGRVSFSKTDVDTYKVQFYLGDSRVVQVKEITEDGLLARVHDLDLSSNPHAVDSKEHVWWENGWKLENYRRTNVNS